MTRTYKYLGIIGALLLPAGAVALTIPNLFSNGDVLTASDLNENFSALETEVNQLRADLTAMQTALNGKAAASDVTQLSSTVSSLQTAVNGKASTSAVTALQTDVATLSGTALTNCTWHWTNCGAGVDLCQATCPTDKFPVAAGCDAKQAEAITELYPIPVGGFPSGSSASFATFDRASCRGDSPDTLQSVFALCCSQGI